MKPNLGRMLVFVAAGLFSLILLLSFGIAILSEDLPVPLNYGKEIILNHSTTHRFFLLPDTADTFNRNYLVMPANVSPLTASEILQAYPSLRFIRYYDSQEERYFSYLAARGGIGKDFSLESGTMYQVGVSSPTNFTFTILRNS